MVKGKPGFIAGSMQSLVSRCVDHCSRVAIYFSQAVSEEDIFIRSDGVAALKPTGDY